MLTKRFFQNHEKSAESTKYFKELIQIFVTTANNYDIQSCTCKLRSKTILPIFSNFYVFYSYFKKNLKLEILLKMNTFWLEIRTKTKTSNQNLQI